MHRFLARPMAMAIVSLAAGCAGGPRTESTELATAQARVAELEDALADAEARIERLEMAGDEQVAPRPAPIFKEEGLTEQLHARHEPVSLPEGFEPGPTAWQEAEVPPGFSADEARDFVTAGALANAVAARLSSGILGSDLWEVTTRVLVDDDWSAASAAILMWGLKDDAGQGDDLRLRLREGEHGWFVESAERRSWCRRGVTDDQRCL